MNEKKGLMKYISSRNVIENHEDKDDSKKKTTTKSNLDRSPFSSVSTKSKRSLMKYISTRNVIENHDDDDKKKTTITKYNSDRSLIGSVSTKTACRSLVRGYIDPVRGKIEIGEIVVNWHIRKRIKEWVHGFRRVDPRYQIMEYFDDAATQGIDQVAKSGHVGRTDPINHHIKNEMGLLNLFAKSSCFTVWRPTSMDSIRKMILGEGVGKGLDIKGKSAKKGHLSGFVPFMQIYEEQHKSQIRTLSKRSSMRIFFSSEEQRDAAAKEVAVVGEQMQDGFYQAQLTLAKNDADISEDEKEEAMKKFMWEMINPEIVIEDAYTDADDPVYGLEIPERLFWEAFVIRKDIHREKNSTYDTGRPSLPAFQDMNFTSMRKHSSIDSIPSDDDIPRPVVFQYSKENTMDPRDLVVAYEENGMVRPVVSDFDCFLVGTRAVSFKAPVPDNQVQLIKKSLSKIEKVLSEGPSSMSWTEKWLNALREDPISCDMPRYGFGDPKSYSLMEMAVSRLVKDGSVRHGAECFNYGFPQELDDQFLVIGWGLDTTTTATPSSIPWVYVGAEGLQQILLKKIKEGYTFPLNPKWVLCDDGWKEVYDALQGSQAAHVQNSLNCWFPPKSGIREKIDELCQKYPKGFQRRTDHRRSSNVELNDLQDFDENEGTAAMDLAKQQLKYYAVLQRARRKLKVFLIFMSFINDRNRKRGLITDGTATTTTHRNNKKNIFRQHLIKVNSRIVAKVPTRIFIRRRNSLRKFSKTLTKLVLKPSRSLGQRMSMLSIRRFKKEDRKNRRLSNDDEDYFPSIDEGSLRSSKMFSNYFKNNRRSISENSIETI
mmetsp:Transcript_28719/g.32843  ORF Transcript_28719/g.32843 Transcript_28719/m.32843 type:complete len:825 (+) Transcript_28719:89-2563(+)